MRGSATFQHAALSFRVELRQKCTTSLRPMHFPSQQSHCSAAAHKTWALWECSLTHASKQNIESTSTHRTCLRGRSTDDRPGQTDALPHVSREHVEEQGQASHTRIVQQGGSRVSIFPNWGGGWCSRGGSGGGRLVVHTSRGKHNTGSSETHQGHGAPATCTRKTELRSTTDTKAKTQTPTSGSNTNTNMNLKR